VECNSVRAFSPVKTKVSFFYFVCFSSLGSALFHPLLASVSFVPSTLPQALHTTRTLLTAVSSSRPISLLSSFYLPARKMDASKPLETEKPEKGLPAKVHTWDAETEKDVARAMNLHFRPNAQDCRVITEWLQKRGHTFSDNALLYACSAFSAWLRLVTPLCFSSPSQLTSAPPPPASSTLSSSPQFPVLSIFLPQKSYKHTQNTMSGTGKVRKAREHPRVLQKWDAETHDDIIVAMLRHFQPKNEDWHALTTDLHSLGHTFTEGALQYVVRSRFDSFLVLS